MSYGHDFFTDAKSKVKRTPRYLELGREPIEASIRHRIGRVLSEQELMSIADAVAGLVDAQIDMKTLKSERDRLVYNIGCSGKVGAEALVQLANL